MVERLRKNVMDENAPASAITRLHKAHFTGCIACTTDIAFNAGSEFRLLMPVGRAPDDILPGA